MLLGELKSVLKKDERLVSDDKLLKNRIVELALKLDKDLIRLLLSNKRIKEHFFTEVNKILIFDKEKFMKFIDNKEFLPDSYTAFKNKIGLTADKRYIAQNKEVVLSWPYKDCILEGGQEKEDEKRKEIFHNEILAPDEIDRLLDPKVFTNFKRIDKNGEHEVSEIKPTDNLIIKGNNLLVLHSLKKRFARKVKLIYIDPPYNTGNDEFKYNDSFNHSTWLTFMKNRLEVAKELLRDDGAIFISMSDIEVHYLKVLCDENFSRENFVVNAIWEKVKIRKNSAQYFSESHDHILIYAKNKSNWKRNLLPRKDTSNYKNPDNDHRGPWIPIPIYANHKYEANYKITKPNGTVLERPKNNYWRLSEENFKKYVRENRIWWGKGDSYPMIKKFLSEVKKGLVPKSIFYYDEVGGNPQGDSELKKIFEGNKVFENPKSVGLIKQFLQIGTNKNKNDIVLDFFAGSGTTAQAVLELNKEDNSNRQFILCEQLDYVNTITVPRVQKVIKKQGGGDFIYCELKELNEQFIQKIQNSKDTNELLKIWEEMKEHAFLSYKIEPKKIDENIEEFKDLSFGDQKRFLIEILDKNDMYVNFSEIEDKEYKVSKDDIGLNKKFYGRL